MKVLVVGGAGYIGGAVTEALLANRIPFTVYDNLTYEPHYLKNVDFVFGDVRDTERLSKQLATATHVIWLAAIVGDGACAITPTLTRGVNQEAVNWLSKHFTGRIVFTSTCSVYGEHHGEVNEEGKTNPLSLYAETKLRAEEFLDSENTLILRLGTAFGISDSYSRPRMDLVANQMPIAAITKGVVTVNGGEQWRPMIHVNDIASAIVGNLSRPVRGIYNLAAINLQIKDLAETTARLTGCRLYYTQLGGDFRDYRVSTAKAVRDGIFQPPLHTVGDGIRQFLNLVRNGRVKNTEDNIYFNVRHLGKGEK